MKENEPVEIIFGTLICKGYPIQEMSPSVQEFLSYESMIREKIQASLKSCLEKGLVEYLYSELLKKRVASMTPGAAVLNVSLSIQAQNSG